MDWLNYHHLRYFHAVAREGSIARASRVLHTSPPAISTQLRQLERSLGEKLFTRQGRGLALTEMGRVAQDYAEQIFALGGELLDTVRGRPSTRPARVRVGIADAVPKELTARLLGPLFAGEQVRLVVHEGPAEGLVADLAMFRLDLVVVDEPPPSIARLKVFQHPLGDAAIGVFAARGRAARLRRGFPGSLRGQPCVLPIEGSLLRRELDRWSADVGVAVDVVAEVEDSALAKTLARDGRGLLFAPAVLAPMLRRNFGLARVGDLAGVRCRYVACTVARRVTNPLVARLLASARDLLAR